MIPKDISYCEDDACNSLGSSLADDLSIDVSNNFGDQRWNCDAVLDLAAQTKAMEPKMIIRCPQPSFFEQKARVKQEATKAPNFVAFRDPDFFPPYDMGRSMEAQDDEDHVEDHAKENISKDSFRRSRISRHSRFEMLQHQVSKPFKFLRSQSLSRDANCLGRKIMEVVVADSVMALDCTKRRKQVQDSSRDENSPSTLNHETVVEKKNHLNLLIAKEDDTLRQNENFMFSEGRKYGRPNTVWNIPNAPTEHLLHRNKMFDSESSCWSNSVPTDESSCDESLVQILPVDLG